MKYPLKGVPQLSKEDAKKAETIIRRGWEKELPEHIENNSIYLIKKTKYM